MKQYIYSAAAVLCLASVGLASCQNEVEEMGNVGGKEVLLRVTANRGDAATRTTLEANGTGGLDCKWSEGDQLLVVNNSNGSKLGVITIVDGVGTDNGTFEGMVDLSGYEAVSLVYLGTAEDAEAFSKEANNLAVDLSLQDGTLNTTKDILTAEVEVDASKYIQKENGVIQTNVTLTRQLAYGYFRLDFPENDNISLSEGDVISITGTGLNVEGTVTFQNGGSIPTNTAYNGKTSIKVTKAKDGNDFYLTILPYGKSADITPVIEVIKNDKVYIGLLGKHTWESGQYVRKNVNNDPVEIKMVDQTNNPLLKWAEKNLVYNHTTDKSDFASSEYTGGSLYQWGRSHGFADYLDALGTRSGISYPYGGGNISSFSSLMGVSNTASGYGYWTGSLYQNSAALKNYKSYFFLTKTPLSTATVYGTGSGSRQAYISVREIVDNVEADYWLSSFGNGGSTWSARAAVLGEPAVCPTGWRIPTHAEYGEIWPKAIQKQSESSFKNSLEAEVRTLDESGESYAINWTIEANGTQQVLVIKSLMVDAETSITEDFIWDEKVNPGIVVRKFPATGGIKAFYHTHTKQNGTLITDINVLQPVPFGKWELHLLTSPVVNMRYQNFTDAGKNYLGGYWMADQKAIATFRLDDGSRFGPDNTTSYVGRLPQPAQDAFAIRCIKN